MHYFFLEGEPLVEGENRVLFERDTAHAYRVLRLRAGDEVVVADGRGTARQAVVIHSSPREVSVLPGRKLPSGEPPLRITLFQALVKGDKMDLIIRQAVELGVYRIVPFISARSIPQHADRQEEKKHLRWESKIRAAAAQCRRAFLPLLEPVRSFEAVLPEIMGVKTFVPWEEERALPLGALLKKPCPEGMAVFFLIGPEGGFEKAEVNALFRAGAEKVHLGPRILRSETAAAAVITMVQAAWGDLSGEGECD